MHIYNLPYHTTFLTKVASISCIDRQHTTRYVNFIAQYILKKQQQLRDLVRIRLPVISDPDSEEIILQYLF